MYRGLNLAFSAILTPIDLTKAPYPGSLIFPGMVFRPLGVQFKISNLQLSIFNDSLRPLSGIASRQFI